MKRCIEKLYYFVNVKYVACNFLNLFFHIIENKTVFLFSDLI